MRILLKLNHDEFISDRAGSVFVGLSHLQRQTLLQIANVFRVTQTQGEAGLVRQEAHSRFTVAFNLRLARVGWEGVRSRHQVVCLQHFLTSTSERRGVSQ